MESIPRSHPASQVDSGSVPSAPARDRATELSRSHLPQPSPALVPSFPPAAPSTDSITFPPPLAPEPSESQFILTIPSLSPVPEDLSRPSLSPLSTPPSSPVAQSSPLTTPPSSPGPSAPLTSSPPLASPAEKRLHHNRHKQPGYVPRPRNAFFLFRADFLAELEANPTSHPDAYALQNQSKVSFVAGQRWRALDSAIKDLYAEKAEEEKRQHALDNPGYQHRILKRGAARRR